MGEETIYKPIYLAEDDTVDAHLFSKIQASAEPWLQAAANGSILLEKLRQADSVPDLTVLGLNAGYERLRTLEEIRKSAALQHLPVIIRTTSSNAADIDRLFWSCAR